MPHFDSVRHLFDPIYLLMPYVNLVSNLCIFQSACHPSHPYLDRLVVKVGADAAKIEAVHDSVVHLKATGTAFESETVVKGEPLIRSGLSQLPKISVYCLYANLHCNLCRNSLC